MKLLNISKLIGLFSIGLAVLFIAIVLNAHEDQFNHFDFIYGTYFVVALAAYGLGYSEIANTVKLGFGVTRFKIFKDFTLSLFYMIIALFVMTIYINFLLNLAIEFKTFSELFESSIIIYMSLVLFFLGQLGMFFGNIRMNKTLNIILVVLFFIASILLLSYSNKYIINLFLIVISVILIITNYLLIKNIKLEINL